MSQQMLQLSESIKALSISPGKTIEVRVILKVWGTRKFWKSTIGQKMRPFNLNHSNQFFYSFYQTPVGPKVLLASFYMKGDALVWFQDSEEVGVLGDLH